MTGNRGVDTDLGWVNRKLEALERKIEALRSERRAASTTIADGDLRLVGGGSLTVDGGEVTMRDSDGTEIFYIGTMEVGDRGLVLRRENGTVALELRRFIDAEYVGQSVVISDSGGNRVVSTEDLLGGLRAPLLEHPFQPIAAATGTALTCGPYGLERTTSSTTFETLFVYDGKRQNPFLDVKLAARCSDGTTAGQVRVVDLATGIPLPDFFNPVAWLGTIPAGTTTFAILDPGPTQAVVAEAAGVFAYIRLGVQVRRTAGTGSITLSVPQSIGG